MPIPNEDGGTLSFAYYPNDRMQQETGRDGTATRVGQYDLGGQLTNLQQTIPVPSETSTVSASYYLDELPRTVDDGVRTTQYAYDGLQSVVARKDQADVGGGGPITNYSYNDAEQMKTLSSTSYGGATLTWSYYNSGLPHQLSNSASSQAVTWNYNSNDTVSEKQLVDSAATLADWAYQYYQVADGAHAGLLKSQTLNGTDAAGHSISNQAFSYQYDAADRVSLFTNTSGPAQSVAWDHNGNRLSYGGLVAQPSLEFSYNADNSIQTEKDNGVARAAYAYGDVTKPQSFFGGVSSDGCSSYTYDPFDRLTGTAFTGGAGCPAGAPWSATYAYDGMDRQTAHTSSLPGAPAATLHYDGLTSQVAVENPGASEVDYELGPNDQPQAVSGSSNQYLYDDGLGNIATAVGSDDQVKCTARYDPFGQAVGPGGGALPNPPNACNTVASGGVISDIFYRGSRQDQSNGQYQFGSRVYDPGKASWLTPDTFAGQQPSADLGVGVDPLTQNRYAYVNGDPANFDDPDGHGFDFWGGLQRSIFMHIGFAQGAAAEVGDTLRGLGDLASLQTPEGQVRAALAAAPAIAAARNNPAAAAGAVWSGVQQDFGNWWKDLSGSDPLLSGRAAGRATVTVATFAIPVGGEELGGVKVFGKAADRLPALANALKQVPTRLSSALARGLTRLARPASAVDREFQLARLASDAAEGGGGLARTIAGGAPDVVKGGQFERVFSTSEGPVGLLGDAEVVDRTFTLRNVAVYPYGAGSLDIGIGGVRAGLRSLQEELGGMGYEQLNIYATRLSGANPGRDVFMRFNLTRFWEGADAGS